MSDIDISGLEKADVLRLLYNRAKVQGMGVLQAVPGDMSREEAQTYLDAGHTYFDYVKGRVMKVNLAGDVLGTGLYDRDNGPGAAESALAEILK